MVACAWRKFIALSNLEQDVHSFSDILHIPAQERGTSGQDVSWKDDAVQVGGIG